MFEFKNPYLNDLIVDYVRSTEDETVDSIWEDIRQHGGSVQHLEWLSEEQLNCFKTAVEIDQHALVMNARHRQRYVCQAQSINLFFAPDADPKYVNAVHLAAWEGEESLPGVPLKSLYYLRTVVTDKVEHMSVAAKRDSPTPDKAAQCSIDNKDECLACQG